MYENYSTGSDLGQSSTADRLRDKAAGLAGTAKQQANSLFETKKASALSEVGQLADALRRVGTEMDGSGMAAGLISTAADRLQSVSSSLENRSLDDIKNDVERFARRNPAAFLGGAIVLGVIAARFLKSHGQTSNDIGFYPETNRYVSDMETPLGSAPATSVGSDFGISSSPSGIGGTSSGIGGTSSGIGSSSGLSGSTGSSTGSTGTTGSTGSTGSLSDFDINNNRGGIR
ncbi:MAG TPA: hypothetical protein VGF48_25075 [Thermoanaerobaculia bacterium]|jgi:hypothetical protein